MKSRPSNAQHSADASPIFIVGQQRSGTTLLTAMLSAHPAIAIAPETGFLNQWWTIRHWYGDISAPKRFEAFWADFTTQGRFSHSGVDPDALKARIASEDKVDYPTVYACFLKEYAGRVAKARWGNKVPFGHAARMLAWYPNARIIYLVRDPRAVFASMLKVPWGSKGVARHARLWRRTIKSLRELRDDPRVRCVRYELLVREPEAELSRICAAIGEEYTSEMIHGRSKESSPVMNREGWARNHLDRAIEKPVLTESVDKWRQELSPFQVAAIEHVLWPEMAEFGYTRITGRLSTKHALRWFLWTNPRWFVDRVTSHLDGLARQGLRRVIPLRYMRYFRKSDG